MTYKKLLLAAFLLIFSSSLFAQNMFLTVDLDTVKAKKFDTGKMWTFEDAPVDYFESTYGFAPDEQWFEHVRLSTLKFANWCSSSFVSEDGLVMTNHHCVDFVTNRIQQEGENLAETGFYANTLSEERKIPGVFVEQIVLIEDVTDQIMGAINSSDIEEEQMKRRDQTIEELEKQYSEDTGLSCRITSLYNGGKYSLYGFRRYEDVRAVYINESEMGLFGGDPDNFTYPRYNPDFAFVRVYDDNGEPLKTDNFFKWSTEGPKEDEPIFVVGNPGSTQRLNTVAQLEYQRDITMKNQSFMLNGMIDMFYDMINEYPDRRAEFEGTMFYLANSAKAIKGTYEGLVDPVFIARKKDFEKKFKEAVHNDDNLDDKFGHIWDGIEDTRDEMREIGHQLAAYNVGGRFAPVYFKIAGDLLKLAEELKSGEGSKTEDELIQKVEELYPEEIDTPLEVKKLKLQLEYIRMNLGKENDLVEMFLMGKTPASAAKDLMNNSVLKSKESVSALVKKGHEAIFNSSDPFIRFINETAEKLEDYRKRQTEITETESILEDELGRALFAVYGTTIPPDATFTLRISDGLMKPYDYNGTIAPTYTTFYGMYDRYYSHKKEYPWELPERWLNPKEGFDMSTPYNFITTNDITGGSSGSAVINKNAEVIGVAFDGNIESLPGNFIFSTKANRCVSVASQGILTVLRYFGGADRIADELELGKIPEKYKEAVEAGHE
ncbi:MAG: S46 family peptidase [Candidatus Cloacimonetes bacterium]|nr:S46 family peptidase [Candidatus Cloacimonadota bacterium]